MLTGTRVYRLDDATKYSVSSIYYDYRGRVVQTHASNHMGGFDDDYFAYTFTGKTTQTEVYTYGYDHAERLLSVTHKLNSGTAVTLAANTYDDTGRLRTNKVHGTIETLTCNYNVRNWLTRIAGGKFNQTLAYNTEVNGLKPTKVAYNGNISATRWKAGTEATERGYQFSYDGLSRLISASYGEGSALTGNSNRYNERVSYDKMGNCHSHSGRKPNLPLQLVSSRYIP